jgi:hypothetical protein
MTDPQSPPGFFAVRTLAMRREGFRGKRVAATMRDGRLALVGEEGGAMWIDPAEVTLVRVGFEEVKWGKLYLTRIWRGNGRTLTLHPTPADFQYRETIRAFVSAMAAAGRLQRVERGVSAFSAWFAPVLFGLLTLAALAIGFYALVDLLWWQRYLPALVPAVLTVLLYANARARHIPRPLKDLAELDRQLPRET